MSDLYEDLDLQKDASADDIKKAFRRKAMKAHPDKGGSEEAMKAINKAYEVLSDPERRQRYDTHGDQDAEPPIESSAAKMLLQVFNDALSQEGDLLKLVRYSLNVSLQTAADKKEQMLKKVAKLSTRRPKIRAKSGQNLVHFLIDQQIAEANATIELANRFTETARAAQKMLDDYESDEAADRPTTKRFDLGDEEVFSALFSGRRSGGWRGL